MGMSGQASVGVHRIQNSLKNALSLLQFPETVGEEGLLAPGGARLRDHALDLGIRKVQDHQRREDVVKAKWRSMTWVVTLAMKVFCWTL